MSYRIVVAVSGRGSNLLALSDALASHPEIEIVLVVAEREVPALERARELAIPTHAFSDFRDATEWLDQLQRHRTDLLVLAGYLKLVPAQIVASFAGRIINIHPALLPLYGGAGMYGRRVHQAVLAAGDAETGATVHLVDEVYDRGDILGSARVPVLEGDNVETLAARVLAAEHRLLPAAVIAAGRAGRPVPFSFEGAVPASTRSAL